MYLIDMPFKKTKAIVELLTREIAAGIPNSGIFPPVSALAQRLGVSRLTMRRALAELVSAGVIEQHDEIGGYCVAGQSTTGSGAHTAVPDFEKLARHIQTQAIQYHSNSTTALIPSRKELVARYGYSPNTVHRALEYLLSNGIIERRGKRFFLPGAPQSTGSSAVIHVCGSATVLDQGSLMRECLREIERTVYELGWSGIRLLLTSRPANLSPPVRADLAGYIVLSRTKGWWTFLSRQPEVPSVYIDAIGGTYWSRGAPGHFAFVIEADNVSAGARVATHLARLGHKSIAYINPIGDTYEWDHRRIEGLRQYYSEEKVQGGAGKLRVLSSSVGSGRPVSLDDNSLAQSSSRVRTIAQSLPYLTPEHIHDRLWGITSLLQDQQISIIARPLFEKAFADREITAWVCANDLTAALATAFLRTQQQTRASRLSLVAFDNSDLAYRLNLTSWDFAVANMGRLAVQCLLRPKAFGRKMPVSRPVDGTLVVRGTAIR